MTSDEVLTALRCCASGSCDGCPLWDDDPEDTTCADGLMAAAADLIEFQQRGLEALTKMDEGLKKHGSSLKELLDHGDEVVLGHMGPTGPPGEPGVIGDEGCGRDDPGPRGPIGSPCPVCGSKNIFWNAEKDINTCADCGWQDKEG